MKIKRKGILKDILYHEAYDKIFIYADGTWTLVTTGTYDPEAIRTISRVYYHSYSRRLIHELLKAIEAGEEFIIDYYK